MANTLEQRTPSAAKEKGQYVLAFGVIAAMIAVTNFPPLVIFFFAVFAYLLLKMFSVAGRSDTRDIFEFYLTANEILRDDDRRWFGFEIHEAIARGESITRRMSGSPPLVAFALGALHNKLGNHEMAVKCLSEVLEGGKTDEKALLHPSPEMRSYVRVLRKIEREPGDAPLTSAAIRALERARKLRGGFLLDESRRLAAQAAEAQEQVKVSDQPLLAADVGVSEFYDTGAGRIDDRSIPVRQSITVEANEKRSDRKKPVAKTKEEQYSNRKPISEVLRDIYDTNAR